MPRILSIAAGHLREAELSIAFQERRIKEWVAVDQDSKSVEECHRRYCGSVVNPIRGSVRGFLAGKIGTGGFDFIYAAGLFDYLKDPVAKALVRKMCDMLNAEGVLLVANFADGLIDSGYMEAFMDWRLIYRKEQGIIGLFSEYCENAAINLHAFTDSWKAIIYCIAEKPH
ncbi:class I SAM-dependent methyltransferase [Alloacidobacterium dinghuense]|uniref:Class I SAM-dependent methyltransferase n=1 Tax=Alloacidobacterium dinghuense TaxID=2763107 RepID=A0A7G8BFT4_9BACT|nr:class I SAM-dependent methyltransferase [Alloacidobacterium dinghuense]QNI31404.1 class I SAM-dependent methyltransferase [Alloacidobacterium dinghuense]